ncbi:MAG: aspartate carbamoyltransferase [Nanoarchaeota archaeon]|nr:aspartate carbamoyltransferase [Nanoarchaeota archaeon]
MTLAGSDILSASSFSRKVLDFIHNETDKLCNLDHKKRQELLKGKLVALLFFEPSTRTRASFTVAAKTLGAATVGFSSGTSTSETKGESLHDTIKMFEGYGSDVIVMRHPRDGAAQLAADVASIPVINAGDGKNQHPTQSMMDTYAIRKRHNTIDGLSVLLVGDLKYGRAAHSLIQALYCYDCTIHVASPESLRMPPIFLKKQVHEHTDLEEAIKAANPDVIYMTRVQKERFPDINEYAKVKGSYVLNRKLLAKIKPTLQILHPLPRVDEIDTRIDALPYAGYFIQAADGMPVRQAILNAVIA